MLSLTAKSSSEISERASAWPLEKKVYSGSRGHFGGSGRLFTFSYRGNLICVSAVVVLADVAVGRVLLGGLRRPGDDGHLGLGVNEGRDARRLDEGQLMRASQEGNLGRLVDDLNGTLLGKKCHRSRGSSTVVAQSCG